MKLKLVRALGIMLTAGMLTGNTGLGGVSAGNIIPSQNQVTESSQSDEIDQYSSTTEEDLPAEDAVSDGSVASTANQSNEPNKAEPDSTPVESEMQISEGTQDTAKPAPVTNKAHSTNTPDISGTTEPTGSPDTVNPTVTPDTADPTTSPDTVKPTAKPDTTDPTASPDVAGPTAKPGITDPTASPDAAKPSATPNVTDPTASPDAAKPGTSPSPSGSPAPGSTETPKPSDGQDMLPAEGNDTATPEPSNAPIKEDRPDGWNEIDGSYYWYEGGYRQGTEDSGKEIYDPDSDAWYWLDSAANGARAVERDVYVESDGGKWMRYDENGHKVTGEDYRNGAYYYFEPITGAMMKGPAVLPDGRKVYYDTATGQMVKGDYEVNGMICHFDEIDGHLIEEPEAGLSFWLNIDGASYWYVDWVRQGWKPDDFDYAGQELHDPVSKDWVWLDGKEQGRMAVNKFIYLDSQADKNGNPGKWVFYGSDGHMLRGWTEDGMYYFDPVYGTMARGNVIIGNILYEFDPETGMKLSERAIEGFEEYDIVCNAEAGVEYDYKTCTHADPSATLMGKAVFSYQTFESDEDHPAKNGYEWKQVTATVTFNDPAAWVMGCTSSLLYDLDYYTFKNGSVDKPDDALAERKRTITYMDAEYEVITRYELVDVGFTEEGTAYTIFRVESQVPVGYDGMVVALYNAVHLEHNDNAMDKLDADSLIFRMK